MTDDHDGEEWKPLQEFDCAECGRHMIVLCGVATKVCAACHTLPGWHLDPKLRDVFKYGPWRES